MKLNLSYSASFLGMTPKIRYWNFPAPTEVHHVETFSAISYTPDKNKPKYTNFLANFRILIAKELLTEDP